MSDIIERLVVALRCEIERLEGVLREARAEIARLRAALDIERRRLAVSEEALRRALENKPSSVHSGMENDCEQDEGA